MANEAHKIKLLVLWDILCKNTDENHALNTDEISELLALRGLNVSRKILVQDIATLCDNGYDVLSYKKKYHYYYVVNRSLETAEVVMLADVINASKLPVAQKKALAQRLAETLCTHQAESISKHIISLDKGRRGNSSFIYNVDAIERAINENKQISFLYFNYDEKHKKVYRKNGNRYTVSPAFIIVAMMNGETTLKRFYKRNGKVVLHPENKEMKDIIVKDCEIQGVLVSCIHIYN